MLEKIKEKISASKKQYNEKVAYKKEVEDEARKARRDSYRRAYIEEKRKQGSFAGRNAARPMTEKIGSFLETSNKILNVIAPPPKKTKAKKRKQKDPFSDWI